MTTAYRYFLCFICAIFCLAASADAQNIAISSINPQDLYVCGVKPMSVTLINTTGSPTATNVKLSMVFPIGITYDPGSIVGAMEFNITDLNKPVFSVPDLVGGAVPLTLPFSIKAGCGLVQQIINGDPIVNSFNVNYSGGSAQYSELDYNVLTGLIQIISVAPMSINKVKGDVFLRTITIKNTRQGPIESLSFRDEHTSDLQMEGINIELIGANNQVNTPTLFTADVPGTYFAGFGDGDNLLEESDGNITLVEKITVTSCGIPSFTNTSKIIVGWGCDGNTCRSENMPAHVTILPSTQNPFLKIETVYANPLSYCGSVPAVQEIRIINTGALAATDVLMDVISIDSSYVGIAPTSFEWFNNGPLWQTAQVISVKPALLLSCDSAHYMKDVVAVVPLIPANDTVRLRFNTYSCQPLCDTLRPRLKVDFKYNNVCPSNLAITGSRAFIADTSYEVNSQINYNIGHCLEDNNNYKLIYWVKSKRLLTDTGALQVIIELPFGLEWDPSCTFRLDGQTPMAFSINSIPNDISTIRAVFNLPFTKDSVADEEICIKYKCKQGMPCEPAVANVPDRKLDYTVYPPPSDCDGCELKIKTYTVVSLHPDDTKECGITHCDEFNMVVDDVCNGGSGGDASIVSGSADLDVAIRFNSWRVNHGFKDPLDKRDFIDNTLAATADGIRIDRFIPGDTMRNELKIAVKTGTLASVNYRLFIESLRSDSTKQDGDLYTIRNAKIPFVNFDSILFAGARVIFKKAGQAPVSCQINAPTTRSDQHDILVATPNIRPFVILDEVANMFDQYDFSLADFIANQCLPSGYTLQAGDSIFFQTDYKFSNNFKPAGSVVPPLVNFRTSICDTLKTYSWTLDDFCTEKPLLQFSGFDELLKSPGQLINPCDISTEIAPFHYSIRLARENMFPNEIRPLTAIIGYSYNLPPGIQLLSTQLSFLKLQENVAKIGPTPLTPNQAGSAIQLDLNQFFDKPLDEGYNFEISTRFDTTCGNFLNHVGITNVGLRYANECMHSPVESNVILTNLNAYQDGSPQLQFFNTGSNVLYVLTDSLQKDFRIINNSGVKAQNAWMIIDSDNNLNDIQLFRIAGTVLVPVPMIGGVFQLDTITPNGSLFFRIKAKNNSCSIFTVHFRFGWGCSPTYNDLSKSCGEFSGSFEIRPEASELELIIRKEPPYNDPLVTIIPFCAPSEDFEFEVANVRKGSTYHVVPTVKLPPGISIVPNSSRMVYPATLGTSLNLPNPVQLPGNIWQFNPDTISPLLRQNGLISFEQEPQNALQIYFKVRAECGAVAGAKPVYGAESLQSCGVFSNSPRVVGKPININGVNAVNESVPTLKLADAGAMTTCGEAIKLQASILLQGGPQAGDSIYITLPAGTSYVSGSYVGGVNASTGEPQVSGQYLRLPLPYNLAPTTTAILEFTFEIRFDSPADCIDRTVSLQVREKTEALCGNTLCSVYVATGEAILTLASQNPELQVNNFQLQTQSNGQTSFSASLENVGSVNATNPVVEFYQDLNGNGLIDATDPLITGINLSNTTLNPGSSLPISGNISLPASAYCNIIALIPADKNCACADRIFPVGGNQVVTKGIGLCSLQAIEVGTPFVAGNTYTWLTTDGISCLDANCNTATYTPPPGVAIGDLVTLILIEKSGECVIERRFEIQFGGNFGIVTQSTTTCQGQATTLEATPGGTSYNWSGPGISNPALETQTITPTAPGVYTYKVTVTFAGACPPGTGTATLTVKPSVHTSEDIVRCAEDAPVQVFDFKTDVPGVYEKIYVAYNGCDSISTITLSVVETMTNEIINICPGDSTPIDGEYYSEYTVKCGTPVTSASGCDSVHCKTVNVLSNPDFSVQDSIVVQAGTQITLDGPSGYAPYQWSAPDLSCTDCTEEDFTVTPLSTTIYSLALTYGNMCHDTIQYRVITCDAEEYLKKVPNAFTPNGDGFNDIFRPIPTEDADMATLLQVYSRWGEKVYEGRGKGAGWDGMIGGKPAASDTYVYILTVECLGEPFNASGEVTLIR